MSTLVIGGEDGCVMADTSTFSALSVLAVTVKVQKRSSHKKESVGKKEKIEKIEKIESVEGAEDVAEVEEVGKLKKVEEKCLVITQHLHRLLHHLVGNSVHRF
jgi:hypothetical protein